MIALVVASQFAGMAYAPAFVFSGETLRINAVSAAQIAGVRLHSTQGATVRETREGWLLTPRGPAPARATFLFDSDGDGVPQDGTVIEVPVALASARTLMRPAPGVYDGLAVTLLGARRIAVVPTTIGSALLIEEEGRQARFAPIFQAEVAVRTAPRRLRTFAAAYTFAGRSGITLLGRPGGIAAVSIRIEADGVRVRYVALFHQRGTLRLLDVEREVSLSPTEEVELFVPLATLLSHSAF
ncbi:MAG: hypothetical protein C4341_06105 [Armatimonadota bacterium]